MGWQKFKQFKDATVIVVVLYREPAIIDVVLKNLLKLLQIGQKPGSC